VRITWYGHACFRLEGSGVAIVTDPYTPEDAGLPPVPEPADVVVMSSALDPAHSCPAMVPDSPRVVNALDATAAPIEIAEGVTLSAVPASEGEDRPDDPKANALYTFELDGIAVCHMGDVGTPLADEQLDPLRGRAEILLALAGGGQTIALPDLDRAIDELAPRLVIPMHFQTPRIRYRLGPLEDFLARRPEAVERPGTSTADVSRATLPDQRTILVLEPLLG
jgi:L-ascorbate metabolism protein UlaG (beta-lactamase superfamily)